MDVQRFSTNIKKYTKDLLNHSSTKNTTKPIILVLLVYTLEQIIMTKKFYSCPATGHQVYGSLFLFGPAVCFFVLGLLLNKSFLDSVTGCYRGKFDHAYVCQRTAKAIRRSTFIGFVWLVLAFANTHFYVCIFVGQEPSEALLKKMTPEKQDTIQKEINEAKVRSTVISWGMFLFAMVFTFFYLTIRRCCFLDPYTLPDMRDFDKLESKAAVAEFKEQIEIIAKREGEKQVQSSFEKANEEGKSNFEAVRETKKLLENKYQRVRKYPTHVEANGSPPRNGTYYQPMKEMVDSANPARVESIV